MNRCQYVIISENPRTRDNLGNSHYLTAVIMIIIKTIILYTYKAVMTTLQRIVNENGNPGQYLFPSIPLRYD